MPLTAETRRTLSENDAKWPVKLILRAVATFLAFLGMILFAVATSLTNQHFINLNGDGDWTDGMALAPVRQANSPPFSLHDSLYACQASNDALLSCHDHHFRSTAIRANLCPLPSAHR